MKDASISSEGNWLFGGLRGPYFLSYAVLGMFFPCLTVYLAGKNLNEEQVAIVIAAGCIPYVVMPMITSLLADTRFKGKTLLSGLLASSGILMAGFYFASTFWTLLVGYVAFRILYAGIFPLIDGMHFGIQQMRLRAGAAPEGYYKIRVMGSLGYMLPSLLMFFLLRPWDIRLGLFHVSWHGMDLSLTLLFSMVTAFLTAFCIQRYGLDVPRSGAVSRDVPTLQAVKVLAGPNLRSFSIALFIVWLAIAAHSSFYPVYLKKCLHLDDSWVALMSALSVTVEIFWMLNYRRWEKWMGLRWMMILGLLSAILRLALLALFPNVPVAIATQFLHGPWVLAMYVIPPIYINKLAADRFRHSIQGAYSVLISGVAVIVGTLLGGSAFRRLGPQWMFAFGAFASLVSLVIIGLTFRGGTPHNIEKEPPPSGR